MRTTLSHPWDEVTEAIDQSLPLCDEPCISRARAVPRNAGPAHTMSTVTQLTASSRSPSFWRFQLGGWLLYAATVTASMFTMRNMSGDVAYHAVFVLSGFILSFVMYGVCHALWQAQVPLIRALFACTAVAYGLGILVSGASVWAEIRFSREEMHYHFHWTDLLVYATGSCFVLAAWAFLYFGIKHYYLLEEERGRLQEAEVMARDAQMRALRYQLQPHFLFNTLNAISTLVLDNQPRIATQMIARLADLLRRTLESPDTHQVSLKEEIAVTKEYLALEKVRFGPRLNVTYAVDPETEDAQVPRFLLQPLVENAIRHGIARRPEGGNVVLRAEAANGRLRVKIENDQAEDDQAVLRRDSPFRHRGVGLANTRARLQQMYGFEATLETHATANRTYEVRISMPFSTVETVPELQLSEAE
jgi:hypothetical protein